MENSLIQWDWWSAAWFQKHGAQVSKAEPLIVRVTSQGARGPMGPVVCSPC